MDDFRDDTGDRQGSGEPPESARYAAEPQQEYEPHPLFPREDGGPENRDIHFISFSRRRSDGVIDNSPEDWRAGEINSWAQVVGPWGGGEYKAIGKDKNHRVVAWYPEKRGDWLLFDTESKPFTLRDPRHLRHPHPATPAPAPLAPPALTPLEAALFELVRELRAAQALSTFSTETVMGELLKTQGEILRTVLSAALYQRPGETGAGPTVAPMALALQLLSALRESAPTPRAQASTTDWLSARRRRAAGGRRDMRSRRTRP
jgi:hypothetical protein